MKVYLALIAALLCVQVFSGVESRIHLPFLQEKEYPYCNSISDPSISCNQRYPNGTYIDGTYPNPNDACSAFFFNCVNGVSYCFDCQNSPEQLYYDASTTRCEFCNRIPACVAAGRCAGGGPVTSTTPRTTTTTPTTTTTTTTRTTTTTPTTTTSRTSTPPTSTTTTRTTTPPVNFICPEENGFFPVSPDVCVADYYSCVSGSPYVLTCPTGSLFDPIRRYCVPASDVSCNLKFDCPVADGFFPIPGACEGLHFVCVNYVSSLQLCPGTSIFDPSLLVCVPDGTASCQTGVTPSTTTTTPRTTTTTRPTTTTPPSTFVCPGTGQYEYAKCSSLYYVCSGGSFIIAQCPPGQLFNPEMAYCEDPSVIDGCSLKSYDFVTYYKDSKLVGKTGP